MEELKMLNSFYKWILDHTHGSDLMRLPIGCLDEHRKLNTKLSKFYWDLFSELVQDIHNQYLLCTSDQIGDPEPIGDFDYMISWLTVDTPFMYMRGSHPFVHPSRVIIYGTNCTVTIDNDNPYVEINPVNIPVRQMFFMEDSERNKRLIEYLKTTDRPVVIEYMNSGIKMIEDAKRRARNLLKENHII